MNSGLYIAQRAKARASGSSSETFKFRLGLGFTSCLGPPSPACIPYLPTSIYISQHFTQHPRSVRQNNLLQYLASTHRKPAIKRVLGGRKHSLIYMKDTLFLSLSHPMFI